MKNISGSGFLSRKLRASPEEAEAERENYVRGATVSEATKPIATDTGLSVRVPFEEKYLDYFMNQHVPGTKYDDS